MMRGCGQVGVVSVCAWEEDAWVWSVHVHVRGIVGIINSKLTKYLKV